MKTPATVSSLATLSHSEFPGLRISVMNEGCIIDGDTADIAYCIGHLHLQLLAFPTNCTGTPGCDYDWAKQAPQCTLV